MKQALQLQLGQQLTMTPQLQQAIRLLQLSALDLQAEIREALESNLMLEAVEDEEPRSPVWTPGPAHVPVAVPDGPEPQAGEQQTLKDYLHWQLELTPFTETDARIALMLIECIDDDGYLDATLDEVREALQGDVEAGIDEIEAVLHRIQRFDPVGTGARSPSECLDVQLAQLAATTPGLALARRLVNGHLEALAGHRPDALAADLGVSAGELERAVSLVQALHPRPGAGYSSTTATEYVVPDVIVTRRNGRWCAELNPELQPRLRINPDYARLADDGTHTDGDHACLREHMQRARWLLKSLRQRAQTLTRVAGFIVEHQAGFFERGDPAMRPLILRDVATALDMHESTVSRVTANKWMHTPRGIVKFRHFFSGQLKDNGVGKSATAVRAVMRELLDAENPSEPLSDNIIRERLAALGYRVARRTVAKYRDNMSIPPASERRRAD